jgi:hypothetical protein
VDESASSRAEKGSRPRQTDAGEFFRVTWQ